MIQITLVKIEGYGKWTLTLGSDREWYLQMLQSKIYYELQKHFSKKNGLVFSNRFDEFFVISNQISINDQQLILEKIMYKFKRLSISMTTGVGGTPYEASIKADNIRKTHRKDMVDNDNKLLFYSDLNNLTSKSNVQIIHLDIDNSTSLSDRLTPYDVTRNIIQIYNLLSKEFLKSGSLTFFLGGDNFMVISNRLAKEYIESTLERARKEIRVKFNCGSGIANNGRRAAELATKSLDTIREMRSKGDEINYYEIEC